MEKFTASFEFKDDNHTTKILEFDIKCDSRDLAYSFLWPLSSLMSSHMEEYIQLYIYDYEEEVKHD